MFYSNHSSIVREVDYPLGGTLEAGWLHLTPGIFTTERAFCLETVEGTQMKYFLGVGSQTLNMHLRINDEMELLILGGYVYVISAFNGIHSLPSTLLGYSSVVSSDTTHIFHNYAELLIVSANGVVRYSSAITIDDLKVKSIHGSTIVAVGMRAYGEDPVEWQFDVADVPIVAKINS